MTALCINHSGKKYKKYNYILTDVLNACKKVSIKKIVIPLVDKGHIETNSELKNLINICNKHEYILKKKQSSYSF